MIQFLDVTKKYPNGNIAVENISLTIAEGYFFFFFGPSGSGKTTLIRMLIREEKPTNGKVFFYDDDVTKYSRNQVYNLRRRIGVIFQDFKLIQDMNAYENVAFVMEAAGKHPAEIKKQVPYVLDLVGLMDKQKYFPRQLAGGEQQRIAIARAIANNPKVLIADEPTGNLDPDSAWDIVQILTKINNWGTTVIMSTHGSDIVNTLGKRVVRLNTGKILTDQEKGVYHTDDDIIMETLDEPVLQNVLFSSNMNNDVADNQSEQNTETKSGKIVFNISRKEGNKTLGEQVLKSIDEKIDDEADNEN